MYNPNLKLNEIFEPNTLRNLTTIKNDPMPHSDNTYYLWVDGDDKNLIKQLLNKDNKWSSGQYSKNSYITLSPLGSEKISTRLIQYGPQSLSSSFTIRVVLNESNNVRITANGWGSSVIELYDGVQSHFLQYLLDNQKRIENESKI